MASYVYTASGSSQQSANIATDKVRIAATTAIHFVTGYPQINGTGTITSETDSSDIVGNATVFLTQLAPGYWIGDGAGNTVGIIDSITDNGNLTLTANAGVAIADDVFTYNPAGVPFAICDGNCEIIPGGVVERSVFVGQGNVVAFLSASAADSVFSITELGMPHDDTGTSGI